MADDVAEVKLGADTKAAQDSMNEASRSIAASLQGIQSALSGFSGKNREATQQAIQNNADLSRSFVELKGSVTGGFNGIIGVIERFRGVMFSLTAILAGGALWKEAISETLKFEDSVRSLQITFGMMSDKATTTAIALGILGKSGNDLSAMGMKVARQLKMNEQGLIDLGVATRSANGQLLPLQQIMENGFKTMQDYRAGADQDEFALAFFGRTVGEVVEIMLRLPAAQERALQLQKELGVEMGPARQAEVEKYRLEVGAFGETLKIIGDKIGEKVMPGLERMAAYFNDVGPSAANVFMKVLVGVLISIDTLQNGFQELAVTFESWWNKTLSLANSGMAAMKALFSSGWAAADAVWTAGENERLRVTLETNAKILGMEADLQKRIATLSGGAPGSTKPDVGGSPLKSGGRQFPMKPGAGADDTSGWDNILKGAESAYNNLKIQQGTFEVWSVEMTRDYWRQVLDFATLSGKARMEIENKFYDAERQVQQKASALKIAVFQREIEAAKDNETQQKAIVDQMVAYVRGRYTEDSTEYQRAAEEKTRIDSEWAKKHEAIIKDATKHAVEMNKIEIDGEQESLNQQVALRNVSAQQKFAIEAEFADKLYALDLKELQDELATLQQGTLAYQQVYEKIEVLAVQHQQKLTQIANAAELDRKQYALQAANDIENSLGSLIDKLVSRTQSLSKTWKEFVTQLTSSLVSLESKQLMQQLMGPGTQGGDFLNKLTGSIFGGSGVGGGISQTANTTALTSLTAAVLANTAALSANSLTSGFSAGGGSGNGLQGVLSMFGDFPSFDVGSPYVPQDSLAFVHKGEAIVPAQFNRMGGGGGVGISMRNQFAINGPIDTRTQQQISHTSEKAMRRASQRMNK